MELKLQFNGSADGLINYLENFAKIRPTLLLEVDTQERAFVAKGLVEDRSSVRYSSLKFEDTNLNFVSDNGDAQERIQVGILNQLPKFIKILKCFNDILKVTPKEGEAQPTVDLLIRYDNTFDDAQHDVLGALSITLKSKTLSMKFDCFRISEFKHLTDEQFLKNVFNVSNETRIVLTQETISSIISTTDIVSVSPREDIVIFNINGDEVYVSDKLNDSEANFRMSITHLPEASSNAVQVAIKRDTFMKMLGKPDSDYEAIIGYSETRGGELAINRVLFASTTNTTKIVISSVTVG